MHLLLALVIAQSSPTITPKATMVTVDSGVQDEVLDWGGTGRNVLLLAGLGNTGYDFMQIVPHLKQNYHVYSLTRRGFGNSSKPKPTVANYSADRLGDDVMAVLKQMNIDKPILIGHSFAGEELSDIGTRYPSSVAGLIYLEAAYFYAFDVGVPRQQPGLGSPPLAFALLNGVRSFKDPITVPILAIYAQPGDNAQPGQNAAEDQAQIAGVKKSQPKATVTVISNGSHDIYVSNAGDVLRDIDAFISQLP